MRQLGKEGVEEKGGRPTLPWKKNKKQKKNDSEIKTELGKYLTQARSFKRGKKTFMHRGRNGRKESEERNL